MTDAVVAKTSAASVPSGHVQVHGFKGTASSVALIKACPAGKGSIRLNKRSLIQFDESPMILKFNDLLAAIGLEYLSSVKVVMTTHGGGNTSKIQASRLALARGMLAYVKKFHDEESVQVLKTRMLSVDKNMLTVDTRRNQSKRFGGPGADARYRKSYR